jgi:hypothetical protein
MPTPTTDIDIGAVARGLRGMLDTFGQEPIARRDRSAVYRLQGAYVCAAMLAGLDPLDDGLVSHITDTGTRA